jgi:hypothetical protein
VIFVIGVNAQSTCASVPIADDKEIVAFSFTVIVPEAVGLIQGDPAALTV